MIGFITCSAYGEFKMVYYVREAFQNLYKCYTDHFNSVLTHRFTDPPHQLNDTTTFHLVPRFIKMFLSILSLIRLWLGTVKTWLFMSCLVM